MNEPHVAVLRVPLQAVITGYQFRRPDGAVRMQLLRLSKDRSRSRGQQEAELPKRLALPEREMNELRRISLVNCREIQLDRAKSCTVSMSCI